MARQLKNTPMRLELPTPRLTARAGKREIPMQWRSASSEEAEYEHPAGWPNPNATGVDFVKGPGGMALCLYSGYAVYEGLPRFNPRKPWTLALWVRPNERDWGPYRMGFPDARYERSRPVLVGGESWVLRLCCQRLELTVGERRLAGHDELPLGHWSHVAVVWNGEQFALYVDGFIQMNCAPFLTDPRTGRLVPRAPLLISPFFDLQAMPKPGAALAIGQSLRTPSWKDKFVGAIGPLVLQSRAWTPDEIASAAFDARDAADRMVVRYSALTDPTGGFSRRPDKATESSVAYHRRLRWFRKARYGLFLHWAPCCLDSLEICCDRQTAPLDPDAAGIRPESLVARHYDALSERFNPTRYDPRNWAARAKAGGMKYVVLTAKHGDGFCLWPSRHTDYHVGNAPYGLDIVGPYVKALRRAGLHVGLYFAPADIYWLRARRPACRTAEERRSSRTAYSAALIRELAKLFRPELLWFDGPMEEAVYREAVMSTAGQAVLNDRLVPLDRPRRGDYITCEGQMPARPIVNPDGTDAVWELAHVFEEPGEGGWSYHAGATVRSYPDLLHELIEAVAKGGNVLRDLGPTPEGEIPAGCAFRIEEIGRWLKTNGKAIYGTHRTRLGRQAFGWTTANASTLYLHVIDWPGRVLMLKDFHDVALDARLLANGTTLRFNQEDDLLTVELPTEPPDSVATVVAVRCRRTTARSSSKIEGTRQ